MKQILGIVGSLRESGNSEVMIKQLCRELKQPHQLRLLRLPEFKLEYCNGCYRCLVTARGCVIRDDLTTVLDAIAWADALILAVPTYFLAAHACLKTFVDRGISFYARSEELWNKPAVGLGVAGIEGKEGSVLLDIERFFAVLMAKNKRSEVVYGALPGETVLVEENLVVAKQLAEALFVDAQTKAGPTCPSCGGQTFRFYSGNEIRCMLCSESGTLLADGEQFVVKIEKSEHPLLVGEQESLRHRDWLLGMVGRFRAMKGDLARVREDFNGDVVTWVRPGSV